jgi:ABC-type transporter Mla subunit MlaD
MSSTIEEKSKLTIDNLNSIDKIFEGTNTFVKEIDDSLRLGLENISETVEELNKYMGSNKELTESLNGFVVSEKEVLNLWNSYGEKFENLNNLLIEGSSRFENTLISSVNTYKSQLNGIREEFTTMMSSLNSKYVEYTNKNTNDLFSEYDKQLATAINKFTGLMRSLEEEVGSLNQIIDTQNSKLENIIEKIEVKKDFIIKENEAS